MDLKARRSAMLDHFQEQAAFSDAYGSPFTARLIERLAQDLIARGPVADLVGDWSGTPRADAVALRLAGALHAAALSGRDRALAVEYPEQRGEWDMDRVWPLARALLAREKAWVADFISSPPQTNEVRRAIVLLLGFLTFAELHAGPFDAFELGASAGLNLAWDRFGYRTESWTWGDLRGVPIDTRWTGPPPPLATTVQVRARAACDLCPLDVRDVEQRLRLRSYIWADQVPRLARFDAAASLAATEGVRVDRADAGPWLQRKLEARSPDVGALVYHSVFLQYLNRESRRALTATLEASAARATEVAPLGWLRLEPEVVLGGPRASSRVLLDLITWPGGSRRILAATDGHANWVEVLTAS